MPDKKVVKKEEPTLGWPVVMGATVLLAIIGGVAFAYLGPEFVDPSADEGADAAAKAAADAQALLNNFADWCITVSGVLLGAGVGLTLGDYKTTTEETTEPRSLTDDAGETIAKGTLAVLKDLSPAKTLIVLSVTLLGLSLWTVTPAKPDTTVTVQSK
jgi:hypothetical protein